MLNNDLIELTIIMENTILDKQYVSDKIVTK